MDSEGKRETGMMKKFLTDKEASEYIGISQGELANLVKDGRIMSYKIGGVYTRFRVEDLDMYRDKLSNRSVPKPVSTVSDRIKDFIYFNDFYIVSGILIIIMLYFILVK
jgi:excisionase family DNA binding protein